VHVHEQAHELWDRERGVRVVELDRVLVCEVLDRRFLQQDASHEVLQRARDEEVLLLQAKLLAREALVVGVEDLGDVLAADLLVDRAPVLAGVERFEVELFFDDRGPQPQEVGVVRVEAQDGRVVRALP
jgi:hypothetical protein